MPKPERSRRFLSVGTKLAVATVLVLASLSLLLFQQLTQRERRHIIEAKAVAGAMVADLFAASCAAPLVFADSDAVAAELEKLRGNRSIVYAAVYSSKEDKIVGTNDPHSPLSFDFQHGKLVNHLRELPERIEVVRGVHDTHGATVGFTVLNFSLADENAAILASRQRIFWFALLITMGTAALLILLARKVIVNPLFQVAEAAGKLEQGDLHARAHVHARDEVGNLALVFNRMGDALVDREQRLVQAQENLRDLFDNMLQAIFTVGPDLRIDGEISAYAKRIFGDVPMAGELVSDFLRLSSVSEVHVVSRMTFFLSQIYGCDDLQWDLSEPDRMSDLTFLRTNRDGSTEARELQLDYAPIYKDGAIVKIMFMVKDVTEMRQLQAEVARRERQNSENLTRVRQIASLEPELFHTFVAEASSILEACESSLADLDDPLRRSSAINSLFRGMHTLKGNARMFKLTAVQDLAHATEDYFQQVREGQVALDDEAATAIRDRIVSVRRLLGEFEKLGRQVLGGEQETPAERGLRFLHHPEDPFGDWRADLANLGLEGAEDVRGRLLACAIKLRDDAQNHGFLQYRMALDEVAGALAHEEVLAPQLGPYLERASLALQNTRRLADELDRVELWPYFLEESRLLIKRLAGQIAGRDVATDQSVPPGSEATLLAATARSFGLPTLAALATEHQRSLTPFNARAVIQAWEVWLADARNLFAMKAHPEVEVDVLGRFAADVTDLVSRFEHAAPADHPALLVETVACARRYGFRLVQEEFEELIKSPPSPDTNPGERLRLRLKGYGRIRREMQEKGTRELLHLPNGPCAEEVESCLAWASQARLETLTDHARSLPVARRRLLLADVRHFNVIMPARRGAKLGQPVLRVLEGRVAALRSSLRELRQAALRAHGPDGPGLAALANIERSVLHLTTSSLGDVLTPVVALAHDLARDRGKALDDVLLEQLDVFLPATTMQKMRGAVVHAIRNAVDHGLEAPEVRINAGKCPRGLIRIAAAEREGWIELAIEDDGRGVDLERVKRLATSRGLIQADKADSLSAAEIHELLFLPGFSTADNVSNVSGRGVGMDAIRAVAHELRGEATMTSRPGLGSQVTLRVPAPRSAAQN